MRRNTSSVELFFFFISRMSDSEVCLVIHFNGELNLENGYPVYNGGDQKMIFISIIRTYSSLVQKLIEVTNWEMHDEYPYMQYLYHNGRAFTLISLKSDDDVHTMFKALRHGMDAIYLYVRRNSDNVGMSCQCQSQSRYTLMSCIVLRYSFSR